MKINNEDQGHSHIKPKIFLALGLTFLFLVTDLFSIPGSAYCQRIRIKHDHVKLEVIFQDIKEKLGYTFVYNDQLIKNAGTVNIDISTDNVEEIMKTCLKDKHLGFYIEDKVIVIVAKKQQPQKHVEAILIQGKVTDFNDNPLPGVSVLLKGTQIGITTDSQGHFALEIPTGTQPEFIFSFIGMKTLYIKFQDIPKNGNWIVVMEEDLQKIDEVVVTGYTTLSKRETASAVTQIKAESVMLNSKSSIDQMLIGQIPGMTIVQNSGEPSATPKIRIRGISSITSSKAPVWVLDGIILTDPVSIDYSQLNNDDAAYLIGNAIAGINPRDIETITVLKDASATAIYGVQAANGVIVITTKKGRVGEPHVSYNTSVTINQRPSYGDFHLMNAGERIQLSMDIIDKKIPYGRVPRSLGYEGLYMKFLDHTYDFNEFSQEVEKMEKRNTDWYDILFHNVISHNHTLSMSGGHNRTTYYGSVGFDHNSGTARGSENKRYTAMMKLNSWLSERVYIGMQINGNITRNEGFHSSVNPNKYAYETSRTIPVRKDNGELFFYETTQKGKATAQEDAKENLTYNILHELQETGAKGQVAGITGKFDFAWNIWKGFRYDFMGSYSYQQSKQKNFANSGSNYVSVIRKYNENTIIPNSPEEDQSALPYGGVLEKSESEMVSYSIQNKISYNGTFGENGQHSLNALFVSEIRSEKAEGFSGTYYGWQPERGLTLTPLLTSEYIKRLSSLQPTVTENRANYVSWIGSAAYTWKNKFTINANIRMDGSNKFGENPKYRFLPIWSVAGKYTLTEENFLKDNSILSDFAIRGGYGIQGNVDKNSSPDLVIKIGPMNTVTKMNESTFKYLPNEDLRWEKTSSYNLGIDFSLFEGRLSGTFDYYHKKGKDMIMNRQVSQCIGLQEVKINAGKLNNTGYEFSLFGYPIRHKDYDISVQFIYSYNKNKLISANRNEDATNSDLLNGTALIEGEPLESFYSYRFAGLNSETGYPTFYAKDGNDYIMIDDVKYPNYVLYNDEVDLVKSGNKNPTSSGSLSLGFRYKSLRLNFGFQYTLGGKSRLPNVYRNEYMSVFDPLTNVSKELTERWRHSGDEQHTNFPALYDHEYFKEINGRKSNLSRPMVYGNQMYDLSDLRVASTNNLRLRNISLSYIFPQKLLQKISIQDLSVNFQATNLFIIAAKKWHGRDPESGDSNNPIPRTYSMGLSVTF